jgi:hypothetical protein
MAITKLPRNAIADDAINSSKIEDGTIVEAEVSGTITNAKLKDGEIANDKLSNSTFTARGTSRALGDSFSIMVDVDWQSKVTSDGSTVTTLEAAKGYFIDNTSAAGIVKLPTSASAGDTIAIKDYAGNFGTNVLVIQRNGHKIQGVENDGQIETNRASLVLVYVDSTKGWLYTNEHNVADLQKATHTEATGGTITESGDYKIHTFTGDGCFVVSQVGNAPVSGGGPSTVDYLVVAGGGGSSLGGSGAGGYRESKSPAAGTYTASPLATPTGITLTATTYPISVGAGGAANGNNGSNSVFSTITSAGGGKDAGYGGPAAGSGGSGGGGGLTNPVNPAGAGNTPPVSPPQGNPGGTGTTAASPANAGGTGGGGGAGAAGQNGGNNDPGNGGNGVTSEINGSPVTRAGGGGGGGFSAPGGTGGSGGGGNGGTGPDGTGGSQPGTAGTANTGGGAGGYGRDGVGGVGTAAAGGKGIVILRYKFQ